MNNPVFSTHKQALTPPKGATLAEAKEDIRRKLAALREGARAMTEAEILFALNLRYSWFGKYQVVRRVSGRASGSGVCFSQTCDVFYYPQLPDWEHERVSPKSGWKLAQAARYLAALSAPSVESVETAQEAQTIENQSRAQFCEVCGYRRGDNYESLKNTGWFVPHSREEFCPTCNS